MYQLKISRIIEQPGENSTFELEPVGEKYPSYLAGQFLPLIFHIGNEELRRSYSFNSSPDVEEPLSITVKRLENGEISRFLHHKTRAGDVLTAQGPQGMFTYSPEPETERTVFLFGAGVGITPLFSILKTALVKEKKSKVVLAYSNRSENSAVFHDELMSWQNRYPERLKIIWIYSNSQNLMTARLNPFYLRQLVDKYIQFDPADALFYSCGPVIYMDLCRISLLGMGFRPDQIKRETFLLPENDVDEDDTSEKVHDTNTYSIVLKFEGKTHELDIPWPKRILDVALEHDIKLPYSCKSGMCSTCIATCTRGGVRMDYNEVLTDEEVAQGRVLVCTGHPTENGTTIEW